MTHTRSDHSPHSERAFARAGFTIVRRAHARLAAQFQPNGQPRCLANMPQTIQGARRRTGAPAVAEGSHQRRVAADQPARRQDLGLGGLLERVQLGVRRGRADAQLRRDVLLAACVPRARSRVRGAAGAACCNRASGMRPQPPASTRRKPPMSARWPNRIADRAHSTPGRQTTYPQPPTHPWASAMHAAGRHRSSGSCLPASRGPSAGRPARAHRARPHRRPRRRPRRPPSAPRPPPSRPRRAGRARRVPRAPRAPAAASPPATRRASGAQPAWYHGTVSA